MLYRRVIESFRHKGLRLFYENGDRRPIMAAHADKIARILARLDQAEAPADMGLPGYRLHPLKGGRAGFWAASVSGNWRIVFRFAGANAADVDLVDDH
jgi:proteic killer suppression protein